ncbi:hypothetical protein JB92DRAFT_1244061 [Gautieria morchelliformis]|nr:hypothetical protein JB92DRAFT_1244061 [Gautieria morchelliformis]
MSLVKEQPTSAIMNSTKCPDDHENPQGHTHTSCHYTRLRRLAIPAILVILTTAALIFLEISDFDSGAGGLLRRATDGTNSSFVKNKLYLIVVIVGLFVVFIAGIALSFWCCKGSFENPCCCPCYLCACCGGLACLECISCGLCAEGIADLNV